MKLRDAYYNKWIDTFHDISVEFMEDCYVEAYLLKHHLDTEMPEVE
jgi:hypothetical protein